MTGRMALFGWTARATLIALLVATIGCTKRESLQEGASDSTSSLTDSGAAPRGQPRPSQPQGTQVGKSDSLINAIAPKLAPWVALWQQAMPEFTPDSLYRVGTAPAFRKGYVQPLKNVYPPPAEKEPVYLILSDHSPDGRYNLIFDWYQYIGQTGGKIEIGGDADSAPLLLDLKRGVSNQFETCGPGTCSFDWGVWVSPTRFALAGSQHEDNLGGTRGRLMIYSLEDSTATTFVTRPIASPQYSKYRAGWREWVASKYRALKPTTSGS